MRIIIICLISLAVGVGLVNLASAQQIDESTLEGGRVLKADFFESNGTFQEKYGVWWLASSNPFRFRRSFNGRWYFRNVPAQELAGDEIILKLTFAVYTNSIESGGKPTAAAVSVVAENPDTQETYVVKNVRIEMNKDEVPIPTYVYVPASIMTADGRIIVEVRGAGQIGVNQERLKLIIPYPGKE